MYQSAHHSAPTPYSPRRRVTALFTRATRVALPAIAEAARSSSPVRIWCRTAPGVAWASSGVSRATGWDRTSSIWWPWRRYSASGWLGSLCGPGRRAVGLLPGHHHRVDASGYVRPLPLFQDDVPGLRRVGSSPNPGELYCAARGDTSRRAPIGADPNTSLPSFLC